MELGEKMAYRNSTVTILTDTTMNENDGPEVEIDSSGHDVKNIYVSKKTIAQGMFDVALLSSNTNQLVHLINSKQENGGVLSGFHITAITLLVISIILQVIVGGCLITITVMSRPCDPARKAMTRRLNSITTIFIFFITILNVIIPSFTPTMLPHPERLTVSPYNLHNCTIIGDGRHTPGSAEAV